MGETMVGNGIQLWRIRRPMKRRLLSWRLVWRRLVSKGDTVHQGRILLNNFVRDLY